MRRWMDEISFRGRVVILILVFLLTILAMADQPEQVLADLGKSVFQKASGTPWR